MDLVEPELTWRRIHRYKDGNSFLKLFVMEDFTQSAHVLISISVSVERLCYHYNTHDVSAVFLFLFLSSVGFLKDTKNRQLMI